jgi:hypothetical protein
MSKFKSGSLYLWYHILLLHLQFRGHCFVNPGRISFIIVARERPVEKLEVICNRLHYYSPRLNSLISTIVNLKIFDDFPKGCLLV